MMGTAHICLSRVFTWEIQNKIAPSVINAVVKNFSMQLIDLTNLATPLNQQKVKYLTELNIDFDNFNRFSL